MPLLLLCGRLIVKPVQFAPAEPNDQPIQKAILSLDDWLVFLCEEVQTASALVVLRKRLDSAFLMVTSDPNNLTNLPAVERDAVETLSLVLNSSHKATQKRER